MIRIYTWAESLWFQVPQKIRYILVGGFNTLLAYGIFAGAFILIGDYAAAIVLQYAISINISVATMRHYVFRGQGRFADEWRRAILVYLAMLAINYLALWLMVDIAEIKEMTAQAAYTLQSVIIIYILHKYFSFRNPRPSSVGEPATKTDRKAGRRHSRRV